MPSDIPTINCDMVNYKISWHHRPDRRELKPNFRRTKTKMLVSIDGAKMNTTWRQTGHFGSKRFYGRIVNRREHLLILGFPVHYEISSPRFMFDDNTSRKSRRKLTKSMVWSEAKQCSYTRVFGCLAILCNRHAVLQAHAIFGFTTPKQAPSWTQLVEQPIRNTFNSLNPNLTIFVCNAQTNCRRATISRASAAYNLNLWMYRVGKQAELGLL